MSHFPEDPKDRGIHFLSDEKERCDFVDFSFPEHPDGLFVPRATDHAVKTFLRLPKNMNEMKDYEYWRDLFRKGNIAFRSWLQHVIEFMLAREEAINRKYNSMTGKEEA